MIITERRWIEPHVKPTDEHIARRRRVNDFRRDFFNNVVPGTICTANTTGDFYFNADARPFFDAVCRIVKRTKAGLILIELVEDPEQQYSFPQANISLKAESDVT